MKLLFAKKNKRYSGFTFIEITMAIAISAILLTISIISFNAIRRNVVTDVSADEVFSALKLAKGYSLQGKMPNATSSTCGVGSVCGYGFSFTSATQYQIFYYYHCNGDKLDCSDPSTFTEVPIDTQALKNGAILSSPAPTDSKVYFSIPWASVVFSTSRDYNIRHAEGLTKHVTVDANGLIQE